MPVNDMTFNQVSTILNSIVEQATGQAAIAPTNTADFVSVAQTLLKTGYDPVINAVSQVLTRTIFSVRPYNRKFGLVEVSESAYGNHIRKLQVADNQLEDDDRYKWPVGYDADETPPDGNGESVDQQIIKKPQVLQTNFYGVNVYQDHYTIFRDQIDNAFQGPEQLGSFVGMTVQNVSDRLEQARENLGRAVVANFIGGILSAGDNTRVVRLLTEYNELTGLELTTQTVYQPANYKAFVQWAYSRILTISEMMTERTSLYQTTVNSLPINRHSPKDRQKMMVYTPASVQMTTMALSDTYHEKLLRLGAYETVNFWQSVRTPDAINVTPGYIGADGTAVTGSAVNQAGVFATIFDEEALGYAVTQSWSSPAPFNARGGYTNTWLHETQRCWNDHTEKGVVFLLA